MEANEKLVFTFKMDKNDYRDTIMCITFGSQKWKRIVFLAVWLFATILFVLHLTGIVQLSNTMYACSLMVMLAVGGVWVSAEIGVMKYKKSYGKGRAAKRRIVVTNEGIQFTNLDTNENGFSPWAEIYRVQETRNTYVIGVGNSDAVILPRHAILTDKDRRNFEAVAREHVAGRYLPM